MVRLDIVSCASEAVVQEGMDSALAAIRTVEDACSRFDENSELVRLLEFPIHTSVEVSPVLFQALRFALEVARWTDGKFDPTIAARMDELGFRKHYLTGETLEWSQSIAPEATFRDVELDEQSQTVRIHRPLRLDLGAVAKGLAVDLAVQELNRFDFSGFVVDAGGDIYAAGSTEQGGPWQVGIRDPLNKTSPIAHLTVQNAAVCTSGTYERRSPVDDTVHHILDAHTKRSAQGFLSLTAVGPYAMLADAFSTAAFLYSPTEALDVLEEVGLEGMLITEELEIQRTPGMEGYLNEPV